MQIFLAFMFGVVLLSAWEVRGGPRWRPLAVLATCAVLAAAFTSQSFV